MATKQNDDLTPLGKVLAFIGFLAGFSAVWQNNEEFIPAFIAGFIVAVIGGFVGNLVWRLLVVAVAIAIAIGSFQIRQEVTHAVIEGIQSSNNESQVQVSSSGSSFRITNNCAKPVNLTVFYKPVTGDFQSEGWWSIDGNDTTYLNDSDGNRMKSNTIIFYYYAEAKDGSIYWGADDLDVTFDGRTLSMRMLNKSNMVNGSGNYEWSIHCNS